MLLVSGMTSRNNRAKWIGVWAPSADLPSGMYSKNLTKTVRSKWRKQDQARRTFSEPMPLAKGHRCPSLLISKRTPSCQILLISLSRHAIPNKKRQEKLPEGKENAHILECRGILTIGLRRPLISSFQERIAGSQCELAADSEKRARSARLLTLSARIDLPLAARIVPEFGQLAVFLVRRALHQS